MKQSYNLLKSKVVSEVKEIQEKLREVGIEENLIERMPPKWDETVNQSLESELQTID